MDVTVARSSDKIQSCEVRTWKIVLVNVIRIYRRLSGEEFPSGNFRIANIMFLPFWCKSRGFLIML